MNWFSFWYSQLQCLRSLKLRTKACYNCKNILMLSGFCPCQILALLDALSTVHSEKMKKAKEQRHLHNKEHFKMKQKEEEEKLKRQKDLRKKLYRIQGQKERRNQKSSLKGPEEQLKWAADRQTVIRTRSDECFRIVSDRSGDWTSLFVGALPRLCLWEEKWDCSKDACSFSTSRYPAHRTSRLWQNKAT